MWSYDLGTEFTKVKSLFGAVTLIKNADKDKYGYNGYDIWFDALLSFPFTNANVFGKHVLFFDLDKSLLSHVDKKKNYILICEKYPRIHLLILQWLNIAAVADSSDTNSSGWIFY